jgi:hypothetical protein
MWLDPVPSPHSPERWAFRDPTLNVAHNHPCMSRLRVELPRREELAEKRKFILHRLQHGGTPSQLLAELKALNPQSVIREIDIRNLRLVVRGHLVSRFDAEGDLYRAFSSKAGEPIGLFFTGRTARRLASRFPTVILMDVVHDTNRLGLPMLHWLGVTATGKKFTMAVMWLQRAEEIWYKLALLCFEEVMRRRDAQVVIISQNGGPLERALDEIWPHVARLTSWWHLAERVKNKCAPFFKWTDGVDGLG